MSKHGVNTLAIRKRLRRAIRDLSREDTPESKRNSVKGWRQTFAEMMFTRKPSLYRSEDYHLKNLAKGDSLQLDAITPALHLCEAREDFDVYDYFRMWSSFPTVDRPGRRMKFLIRDIGQPSQPLMGICCLSSVVRQIGARDQWIGWRGAQFATMRQRHLAHILDISTCVSMPPYSFLTAGKLIAAMMASNEVRSLYRARYYRKRTRIMNRVVRDYVLLTTLGGYGRNAPVYKGLAYNGSRLFEFVGYTKGYSTFQIPPVLYAELKRLVLSRRENGVDATLVGGANAKIRILRFAARELGIPEEEVVFSGHRRAVFCAPVASNWRDVLLGKSKSIEYENHQLEYICYCWKTRWMAQRSADETLMAQIRNFNPEELRMSRLLDARMIADLKAQGKA